MRMIPGPVLGTLLSWVALTACSSAATPPAEPVSIPTETAEPSSEVFLRVLLTAFAADSLEGRSAGSPEHYRATTWLANQARALGLEPAGEDGTYFQEVPIRTRTPYSTAVAGGQPIELVTGVVPVPPVVGFAHSTVGSVDGVPVVYGGRMFSPTQISAEDGRGKVVVLGAGLGPDGQPVFGVAPQTVQKFSEAAAVVMAALDYAPPGIAAGLAAGGAMLLDGSEEAPGPLLILASDEAAQRMIGGSFDDTAPGTVAEALTGEIGFRDEAPEAPTRNVVAVLPGSDPSLSQEYVVLSAHSDHLAPTAAVADHDSLRAYLEVVRPRGAEDPPREPTADEAARIALVRAAMGTDGAPRPDSIRNGADDDGSGSVALLDMARTLSASPPRRSILFVWHTAEELGLFGARYFTDHPTVPLESIVAALNSDMIGRGSAEDTPGGGPGYAQLIGSRRLSTELGDLVEAVNEQEGHGFTFDYTFDADGHPDNYYCRSDHYMYARYGVPIVFFSTGGHRDYHQLTDEPEHIDYRKLSRVAGLVASVAARVADLDERVVVDGPIPDPSAPCQQ